MVQVLATLTFPRCGYSQALNDCLRVVDSGDWSTLKLIAFDAPLKYAESYEERLQFLQRSI